MQLPLIHEDFYGAMSTCVAFLGGAKKVGVMLRPEYEEDPDKAARWLLACLNPARDEKLSWEQTFKIMRKAKDAGCHVAMHYIAQQTGYTEPQPIEPADEAAELKRQFIESVNQQRRLLDRLERIGGAV